MRMYHHLLAAIGLVAVGCTPGEPGAPPPVAAPQTSSDCWTLADEQGRDHEVCITQTESGRSPDGGARTAHGRIVVTRGDAVLLDRTYASVLEDGAAGSVFSTYRSDAGDPIVVLRRAGDCPDKCLREVRVPALPGAPVLERECDVSCTR